MNRRLVGLIGVVAAFALIAAGLILLYSVYGRVQTPLRLSGDVLVVEGAITEKTVERRSDRLLPFAPAVHVVRYAFPSPPRGQMRNGEQVVTRAVYEHIGKQGQAVEVTFNPADPGISAVYPYVAFPGSTGWRLGIALAALAGGLALGLSALQGLTPGPARRS
jgi:hypothetical protein